MTPGILELDLHGKNTYQAKVALEAALRRAGAGTYRIRITNNGQTQTRRPDILLFVNGMPLCIIELKNPADKNATIYDAWEQINIRYWRDIPHLLHYCPLADTSPAVAASAMPKMMMAAIQIMVIISSAPPFKLRIQ